MKLRALIVDDEMHARENLKYLLENYCPEIEVAGTAADVQSATVQIMNLQPQVIFLDICMPSGTEGFDLLDAIPEKKFQVVFVTAFKEYAIRALNANAIHYLQKPVDVDDLKAAVSRLVNTNLLFSESHEQLLNYVRSLESISRAQTTPIPRITIHHPRGFKIAEQGEFMYLQGEGNHTSIVFRDGSTYVDNKPIGVYESMLEPREFFRIHRSHIVNLACIKELLNDGGCFVVMKNDVRLPVSRTRLPQFMALFKGSERRRAG